MSSFVYFLFSIVYVTININQSEIVSISLYDINSVYLYGSISFALTILLFFVYMCPRKAKDIVYIFLITRILFEIVLMGLAIYNMYVVHGMFSISTYFHFYAYVSTIIAFILLLIMQIKKNARLNMLYGRLILIFIFVYLLCCVGITMLLDGGINISTVIRYLSTYLIAISLIKKNKDGSLLHKEI